MAWTAADTVLRNILAGLYPTREDSYRVVDEAGIPRAYVSFSDRSVTNWHNIVTEAKARNLASSLINAARSDYPENSWLKSFAEGDFSARGFPFGLVPAWHSAKDDDALEKITGRQTTLLPIGFLAVGLERARSVARIVRPDGACGTGFLIRENVLVTNHHVLPSKDVASESKVFFNLQKTKTGLDETPDEYEPRPDVCFATSSDLPPGNDWTAVALAGNPNAAWGALRLFKVDVEPETHVNIIQHPSGGPKQIALYHNVVAFVGDGRVQYLTDTLPGSSGSPVFDSEWRVVAVHHSGGWLPEPGSQRRYFRNEGIHVNCLIDGLLASKIAAS